VKISHPRIVVPVAVAAAGVVLILRFAPHGAPAGTATHVDAGSVAAVASASTGPAATLPPSRGPSGTPTSNPGARTSATVPDNDGADNTAPVLVQPTTQADVQETATAFTAAWLNTYHVDPAVWRADLLNRVTPDLAEDLADADPATVPAGAKTGKVTVTRQEDLYGATAPIVAADGTNTPLGTLELTVVQRNGVWLISAIDWEKHR
jgi:hypothetical protein